MSNRNGMGYLMDDLTKYDPVGHSVLSSSAPELHGEWMEVKRKVRLAKKKEVRVCFKIFLFHFQLDFECFSDMTRTVWF